MWEALREAVDEEMEADPTVCLMGMISTCLTAAFATFRVISILNACLNLFTHFSSREF